MQCDPALIGPGQCVLSSVCIDLGSHLPLVWRVVDKVGALGILESGVYCGSGSMFNFRALLMALKNEKMVPRKT